MTVWGTVHVALKVNMESQIVMTPMGQTKARGKE